MCVMLVTGKALVPGCGRGYAPLEFAKYGYDATGIDISETAVATATAYIESQDTASLSGHVGIVQGSFFDVQEQYDVVYDYTFLCALDPEARDK